LLFARPALTPPCRLQAVKFAFASPVAETVRVEVRQGEPEFVADFVPDLCADCQPDLSRRWHEAQRVFRNKHIIVTRLGAGQKPPGFAAAVTKSASPAPRRPSRSKVCLAPRDDAAATAC
jgi:hypothetical protein